MRTNMMPPSATFAYVVRVPDGGTKNAPWVMDSLELHTPTGKPLSDNRLVGWKPLLHINDAGLTPNPSVSRPSVLRSELRLVATDKECASVSTVSYFLDRALVNVLRAGDVFHMAGTGCGGLGISALRQDKLIFAVGQISAVPCGSGIKVGFPADLLEEAEAVFRRRDHDFEFPDWPIEVRVLGTSRILYGGAVRMDGYHVQVQHGPRPGDGGEPECVSICLEEVCDWVAASASAQLLNLAE
jgi:hypothetical protein